MSLPSLPLPFVGCGHTPLSNRRVKNVPRSPSPGLSTKKNLFSTLSGWYPFSYSQEPAPSTSWGIMSGFQIRLRLGNSGTLAIGISFSVYFADFRSPLCTHFSFRRDLLRRPPPESCCFLWILNPPFRDPKWLLLGSLPHATLKTSRRFTWNLLSLPEDPFWKFVTGYLLTLQIASSGTTS